MVTGTLEVEAIITLPLSGTVSFRGPEGTDGDFLAVTGSDGRFQLGLPIGTYTVSGRSSGYQGGSQSCNVSGGPVTVNANATLSITVACQGY